MNKSQLEILDKCGFIKSQMCQGHMHYGKQMNYGLLVITDTLDWYISLPIPVVVKDDLATLKIYETYIMATIGELVHAG